jgi:4-hydroxy-tetrahydrodipicolinate synthase
MKNIGGTVTALITPFNQEGEIDYVAFENIVKWQIQNGVKYLVVNGTTGESPNIDDNELVNLVVLAKKSANNQAKIIVGVGTNSTKNTIKKIELVDKNGADAVLAVCPYYNKPIQEGLYQHFSSIAKSTYLPIILYNIPGRSVVNMDVNTVEKLVKENENIVAIKECASNICKYMELSSIKEDFRVLTGDDTDILAAYSMGACGVISVLSNVLPDITVSITNLCEVGDFKKSLLLFKKVYNLINMLFVETSPAPVKFALSKLGLCQNKLRLPMVPLSRDKEELIIEELKKFYEL